MMQTELATEPALDAQIVSAVRGGDVERYRELVERHERRVFAVAWSRLGDAALAEEATQEAFIRGYRRLWLLRDGAKFAGWIASIGRRAAINLGLQHRRELDRCRRWALEQPEAQESPAEESAPPATPEMLRQALEELPAAHRECLLLYYLEGKSGPEAAVVLGISDTAFRARLHRARAALREHLEEKLEGSLQKLRPAASVVPVVMAAILASSTGKAAASVGAKALTLLGKSFLFAWLPLFISLVTLLPGLAIGFWVQRLERRNYRDPEGFRAQSHRQFSRSFLWGFPLIVLLAAGLVLGAVALLGKRALPFIGVGPLLLFLPFYARTLVIQRNPFQTGMFAYCVIVLAGVTGLFLGWIPIVAYPVTIAVALLLLAMVMKHRPARMDYSLHQRAARGVLRLAAVEAGRPQADPLSRKALLAFARFLGSRWLANSHRWEARGLALGLPPVKLGFNSSMGLSLWSLFRPAGPHGSSILLQWDGGVSARCSEKDAANLSAFAPGNETSPSEINEHAAAAVRRAWTEFRAGNLAKAERTLGQTPEAEIFKVPPARSWAVRLMQLFLVASALPAIVLFAAHFFSPTFLTGLNPVNLTETQVRAFLANIQTNPVPVHVTEAVVRAQLADIETNMQWGRFSAEQRAKHIAQMTNAWNQREPDNAPTLPLSTYRAALVLPSTNLFTAQSLQVMQESVFRHSGLDPARKGQWWTSNSYFSPDSMFCRALVDGWLNWNDLGLDPTNLAETMHQPHLYLPKYYDWQYFLVNEVSWSWVHEERFTVKRIYAAGLAKLRWLRALDSLDLVDRDKLIRQIASVQVHPGTAPPGEPIIHDWQKVRGLFYTPCNPALLDTYYSVASLEILGGLDKIDREACIEGILRLHHGRGYFSSPDPGGWNEYHVMGDAQDTFAAFEVLRILGGLDRVKDLDEWQFRPEKLGMSGFKTRPNWNDIEAWVCQQGLAKSLAEHKANPKAPYSSLRDP